MVVLVNYPKKSLFQANDRLTEIALVIFPQKSSFNTTVQLSNLRNFMSQAIISYDPLSKNLKI